MVAQLLLAERVLDKYCASDTTRQGNTSSALRIINRHRRTSRRMPMLLHSMVLRQAARALAGGGRMLSPTVCEWNVAGDCASPVTVVKLGRPEGRRKQFHVGPGFRVMKWRALRNRTVARGAGDPCAIEVRYIVRCNKCARCARKKRRMWTARALAETRFCAMQGCRTWFGTLTCSPDYLYRQKCLADKHAACRSINLAAESPETRFAALDRVIYRDIARYLKRLRKAGNGFRFMLVTERVPPFSVRKDGTVVANVNAGEPHFHILIHETDAFNPLRKDALRAARWPGGFIKFNLVDNTDLRPIAYVCKYAAKGGGRVRASIGYGEVTERAVTTSGPEDASEDSTRGANLLNAP